jgi:recombination protein RecR
MKNAVESIAEQFRKLPGIGVKSARRLAYFMLERPQEEVDAFVSAIVEARKQSTYCSICGNLDTSSPCSICSDETRDHSTICVVEQPPDVQAIERSQEYHGVYHVLHGALSPLDGVGPEQLKIKELLHRLESNEVKEVIIATDPDTEGEATAYYLSRLIKPSGIRVTRIARGLPAGGDIGYADSITLAGAVENRREM